MASALAVLCTSACGPSSAEPKTDPAPKAQAAPARPVPSGFVVIAVGTQLFRRAADGAPSIVFSRSAQLAKTAVFAVVEHNGTWIRLRNLPTDEGKSHCGGTWDELDALELDLWAREKDLSEVATTSIMHRFADGTSVMLAAGTPLRRTTAPPQDEHTWYTAGELSAGAKLPIEPSRLARYYLPGTRYTPSTTKGTLGFDATLVLGGTTTLVPANLRQYDGKVAVFGQYAFEGRTLSAVGTACAELRVFAQDGTATAPNKPRALPEPPSTRHIANADTQLFWPNGDDAGHTRKVFTFVGRPTTSSELRCFRVAQIGRLCARAEDLKAAAPSLPDSFPKREALSKRMGMFVGGTGAESP